MATPLSTLDPGADSADLDVLRDVVGAARVVFLGESAHFTAEFVRLRDRVLRFLVRELGFSAFVLESGLAEGIAVDDWVRGGPGDLAAVARHGITWGMGRCAEVHAQLRWMRQNPVRFYGMDVPGWGVNPAPAVRACLARVPARTGDDELLAAADLGTPSGPPPAEPEGCPPGLDRRLDGLVERAEVAGDGLALQCARGARRVAEFLDHGLCPGGGRNLRNEVMAENLRWILRREQRVLVGGHNAHLQRGPSHDGTTTVGGLLEPLLGDDLVVLGTTRAAGPVPAPDWNAPPRERFTTPAAELGPPPPHALDAVMDTAGYQQHLVDFGRTPREDLAGVTAMYGQHLLVDVDPRRCFDAVVHIRHISAARGVPDGP